MNANRGMMVCMKSGWRRNTGKEILPRKAKGRTERMLRAVGERMMPRIRRTDPMDPHVRKISSPAVFGK